MTSDDNTTEYKGFTIILTPDADCQSPRVTFGNLGTMICWHKRCSMGDATVGNAGGKRVKDIPYFQSVTELVRYVKYNQPPEDVSEKDYPRVAVWLPVYLYEHSGRTVRTFPFHDPWDSGQVGFIYVTREKLLKEHGRKHLSMKLIAEAHMELQEEVQAYDMWLTGDIWWYSIYGPDDPNHENPLDSMGGLYGYEYAVNKAKEYIDYCTGG